MQLQLTPAAGPCGLEEFASVVSAAVQAKQTSEAVSDLADSLSKASSACHRPRLLPGISLRLQFAHMIERFDARLVADVSQE